MILRVLIAMIAGWLQRHQQQVIAYLQEENRVLKAHLDGHQRRIRAGAIAAFRAPWRIWGMPSTRVRCVISCVGTTWSQRRNVARRA